MNSYSMTIKKAGVILILTSLLYWGLWNVFFQQDEWVGFGRILYAKQYGIDSLIRFSGFHFTPFSIFTVGAVYTLFGLHHEAYGVLSILLHALNAILVYLFAFKLTKKSSVALVATLFFLCSYTPSEAVIWYAASFSFLPSALFALLALVVFETRAWYVAFVLTFIAAGFRENAVVLFAYFTLRTIFFHRPQKALVLALTGVSVIVYAVIRFLPLAFSSALTTAAPHIQNFRLTEILSQGASFLVFYVPRLILPRPIVITVATWLFGSQTIFAHDTFLNISSVVVWVGVIFLLRKMRDSVSKTMFISLLISFAPFFLIPKPHLLEYRHYYLPTIFFSVLMATLIPPLRLFGKLLVSLLLLINVALIRQEIANKQVISAPRIQIVQQLSTMYTPLPLKAIFYNADPTPFQSGVGQMLLVIFGNRQDFTPFLQNYFLWGQYEQGYKQVGDRGFGYFTDFSLLQEVYCQNNLAPDNLFAFSWDENTKTLRDTSAEIRTIPLCQKQ